MLLTCHLISKVIHSFIFQYNRYLMSLYYCNCGWLYFLKQLIFMCTHRKCRCSICRLNLALKFHSIYIFVPAHLQIHVYVCNVSVHRHLRAHARSRARARVCVCVCVSVISLSVSERVCVCVCVCVSVISLSVSDVNHLKKEISNCMGTILRLRHLFVLWHHTNHILSAPLLFALNNIFVLISQTTRYDKKNTYVFMWSVCYSCPILSKIVFGRQRLLKIPSRPEFFHADGQTDK